jgi:hypothetical protein
MVYFISQEIRWHHPVPTDLSWRPMVAVLAADGKAVYQPLCITIVITCITTVLLGRRFVAMTTGEPPR